MTLHWRGGLTSWFKRSEHLAPVTQSPQQTESTESDSDFGIDDIDEDERVQGMVFGAQPASVGSNEGDKVEVVFRGKTRSGTVDTLGSNADLVFPDVERRDTLEYEGDMTLAEGLDPGLLFDEENTFTLDSLGSGADFTLGGTQTLHLLDAVSERGYDEDDYPRPDLSPTPEFATIHSSNEGTASRDSTLDGRDISLLPSPPADPKPASSGLRHRSKQPSSTCTTDTEFYVISDEEVRAAEDDLSEGMSSADPTDGSLRDRITGRIKQLSGGGRI